MYTRDGLKPEVAALLDLLRSQRPPDRVLDYREQRALGEAMDAFFNVAPPSVAVEREIAIPGPVGDMAALVFAPQSQALLPLVLHLHGGGYVFQSTRTYATMWKTVANAVPAVVVSLDYRMAPEHPYPAAVEDAAAAVRWLRTHAGEVGGDPSRIALTGESAGGGLAPATALRLAADGDEQVRGVAIHTPWLDLTMSSESIKDLGPDDPMLDSEMLAYWRDMYVPDEAARREPQASPVFGDLSAFPPAFVAAGAIDPLCAEGEQFARALADAGRDVEFKRYEGMPHIFPTWPQLASLPEVADVTERTVAFLRRVLG
jgi:acetyl esterase